MFYDNDKRPRMLAEYIIEHKSTVRSTASAFGISKSTVHKDVSSRLMKIDPVLHRRVQKVLDTNKSERHIRGGIATKLKYECAKQTKNNN